MQPKQPHACSLNQPKICHVQTAKVTSQNSSKIQHKLMFKQPKLRPKTAAKKNLNSCPTHQPIIVQTVLDKSTVPLPQSAPNNLHFALLIQFLIAPKVGPQLRVIASISHVGILLEITTVASCCHKAGCWLKKWSRRCRTWIVFARL